MKNFWWAILVVSGTLFVQSTALPAEQPVGAADAARIKPEEQLLKKPVQVLRAKEIDSEKLQIPDDAKNISFVLKEVSIKGSTVYSNADLKNIYESDLGKKVTLEQAYIYASQITQLYREDGYFLSLAAVMPQISQDGVINISVIEGYIHEVMLDDGLKNNRIVKSYTDRLLQKHPVKITDVENFILSMNSLPGYSFRSVLSSAENTQEGAVSLMLIPAETSARGQISFDNYSSKFLGPNQITGLYSASILPLQQTSVTALSGIPSKKLKYFAMSHMIVIAADLNVEVAGSMTKANPGFTLEPLDIATNSDFMSAALVYNILRQRDKNLFMKFGFDMRNTSSDIANAPLTRDKIRALRFETGYDFADKWSGNNSASLKLSWGIKGFGANNAGDINLSRAAAKADFSKAEFEISRTQGISDDFDIAASMSGQWTDEPLYSAEEYGFGGQSFGRAYDSSEITGDKGLSGALEIRYSGLDISEALIIQPYGFYDIGAVWNEDPGQNPRQSGSSAGFGFRAQQPDFNLNANLGLAWPLTRNISNPIYGQAAEGPRILLQIGKAF